MLKAYVNTTHSALNKGLIGVPAMTMLQMHAFSSLYAYKSYCADFTALFKLTSQRWMTVGDMSKKKGSGISNPACRKIGKRMDLSS
jgi:hypothetical protein